MSIKLLQEKIGVTADGAFGPNTLKAAMAFYEMTPYRAAHFFGQTGHETAAFKLFSENLNYSAGGLKKIFGKYFPGDLEEEYARKPYRGRGALQLTGKNNYTAFAKYLDKPEILDDPDLVSNKYAFESAMFFFDKNNLWSICDKGIDSNTMTKLTRRINGGTNGLEHRKVLTLKYYEYVK